MMFMWHRGVVTVTTARFHKTKGGDDLCVCVLNLQVVKKKIKIKRMKDVLKCNVS